MPDDELEGPVQLRLRYLVVACTIGMAIAGVWIVTRPPRWLTAEPTTEHAVNGNGNGHAAERLDVVKLIGATESER